MKMLNHGVALLILSLSGLGCGNALRDDGDPSAREGQGGATPSRGGNGGRSLYVADGSLGEVASYHRIRKIAIAP
jgi:hypothetical protein